MTKIQRGAVLRVANAWDDTITGTATASVLGVALADRNTSILEVIVQNDPDSAESAFIGNPFNQYFELVAGASLTVPVNNLARVYVRSAAGSATINWIAGV